MRRAVPSCVGAALALAMSSIGGLTLAAPSGSRPIDLTVNGCPDLSIDELRRLLAVELAGRGPGLTVAVHTAASADGLIEHVTVQCLGPDAPSIATLSLSDLAAGQTTSRRMDLADVPTQHRPRLLAIAIVELMSEPHDPTTPAPERSETVRVAPAFARTMTADTSAPTADRGRWRFSLAALTFRASGLNQFLWGGMGKAGFNLSDRLAGEVDVGSAGNSVPISLGMAGILLVSAGAAALVRIGLGSLELDSGVGFRGGLVHLVGTPASDRPTPAASVESRTVLEPWGGPFLTTRLTAYAGRHASFLLGLEGGYSVAGVVGTVDGVTEVAITRLWVGLSLGLGWSP